MLACLRVRVCSMSGKHNTSCHTATAASLVPSRSFATDIVVLSTAPHAATLADAMNNAHADAMNAATAPHAATAASLIMQTAATAA